KIGLRKTRECLDSGLSTIISLEKLLSELIHGILNFSGSQLIEECNTEVSEKQTIEDTMLELVKICQEKEFLCIHDDIDDLIESALNSKLLLINSNSQHLDKKEQEAKNVVEQPAKRGNRSIQSLQNFRHLLSMGYEHLSITPETKSDEVTESNADNLLLILSKCEVTSEDEVECDMPANDDCSPIFTNFSKPLFNNDDLNFSDDESLSDEDVPAEDFKVYSNPLFDEDEINSDKLDPHCFNVESDFVKSLLNRDTFIDYSSKFNFSGELAHVNPEIPKSDFDFEEEIRLIESLLYDNSSPRPPEELNAEIADTIVESIPLLPILVQDGISQREEIDIVTEIDDVLPPSVENDDDLSNDPLLEEADLFLFDNSIPPGIENFADNPDGDIHFLEELLINDSILSHELFNSNFEDNPLIPRPPPEPPDAETDAGEEISVVMNDKDEDVYSSFIFVIFAKIFSLLFAKSEDTIFDPGKPVLQPHKNQSAVRQPNAFKSERPRISNPRFASQVDVNNNLSKPVTTHYLPKGKESACAKPHYMITLAHLGQKCVFNANHNSCVTKLLNEVNSSAKVPSNKATNRNNLVERTSFAKKQERHILKGHRFSIKKTSVVHEKTMTPKSCLKWKSTGKIFKTVCLRWVPTGKIFISSTAKVDSEPTNGSNEDITNQYECEQSLDVSAGTLNLSAYISFNPKKEGL
nr:hypothetical protein [Tanacetum cinerariifolium]